MCNNGHNDHEGVRAGDRRGLSQHGYVLDGCCRMLGKPDLKGKPVNQGLSGNLVWGSGRIHGKLSKLSWRMAGREVPHRLYEQVEAC